MLSVYLIKCVFFPVFARAVAGGFGKGLGQAVQVLIAEFIGDFSQLLVG